MDITAIKVAVERITPSKVRALRSLLARSDSNASRTASISGTPMYSGYVRERSSVPGSEPAARYFCSKAGLVVTKCCTS